MDTDISALLRRVDLEPDAWAVHELAHNRRLTPGVWELPGPDGHLVLKWLRADRDAGSTAWYRRFKALALLVVRIPAVDTISVQRTANRGAGRARPESLERPEHPCVVSPGKSRWG